MKRKPIAKWLIFLFLVLGSVSISVAWHYFPRERSLLSHSSSVMSLKWTHRMPVPLGWLSDHEVLFCYVPAAYVVRDLTIVDTRTGVHRLLGINKYLPRYSIVLSGGISPDRQWLLMEGQTNPGKNEWMAARLDGTRVVRWTLPYEGVCWRNDSQGVLTWDEKGKKIAFYPLDKIQKVEEYLLPAAWSDFVFQGGSREGLLACDYFEQNNFTVDFTRVSFASSLPTRQNDSIVVPEKGRVTFLEISTQGDQIAWQVRYERKRSQWPFLTRFFPQLNTTGEFVGLWVSRIDGTGLREVGHVRERLEPRELLGDFGWLPDGKSLWYEYHDRLWRVPVPE